MQFRFIFFAGCRGRLKESTFLQALAVCRSVTGLGGELVQFRGQTLSRRKVPCPSAAMTVALRADTLQLCRGGSCCLFLLSSQARRRRAIRRLLSVSLCLPPGPGHRAFRFCCGLSFFLFPQFSSESPPRSWPPSLLVRHATGRTPLPLFASPALLLLIAEFRRSGPSSLIRVTRTVLLHNQICLPWHSRPSSLRTPCSLLKVYSGYKTNLPNFRFGQVRRLPNF